MRIMNKADIILMNEARKIKTKIDSHKREIIKLESTLTEINKKISQD